MNISPLISYILIKSNYKSECALWMSQIDWQIIVGEYWNVRTDTQFFLSEVYPEALKQLSAID